jgi:DNA polymerase-3 subunit delta'
VLTFREILGQDSALEAIRAPYLADRLPHGLVFAGPVGVGKATTARALAALFLCENPKGDAPCGKCESCRVFEAGNHPDYHVITKELIRYHDKTGKSKGIDLSIHVIRPELIEQANRKAMMGRGKVFIVEQAELMNAQAQNAMLKTLEEPAGRTLIILLTDQPGMLLPTVRSRCQLIPFAALDDDLVRRELQNRCGADKSLAADAVRFAEGSIGNALRWIADGVIERARDLATTIESIVTGDGAAATNLPEWFKSAAEAYAAKQLDRDELASKDQATREGLILYLRLAANIFRRRMAETDRDDALERCCDAIEAIVRAEQFVDANVNIALIFQQLAIVLEGETVGSHAIEENSPV